MFCQKLACRTHKFASRVNLEKLGPLQRPPFVDARQGIGDLCCGLASKRLSLLEAAGNIDDCESIFVHLFAPGKAVMGKKQQVRLVDLVWHTDIKLWAWDFSGSREVDLPDGLLLEPVLGHIFRNLGSCGEAFDGCEPLPVAPGAIIGLRQLCCQARVHHPMKPSIPAAWSVSNMPKPQAQAAAQSSPGGSSGQREPLSRSVPSFSHLGARARATSQQPQSASRAVALSRVERRGRPQAEPSIVLRGDPSCRYMFPFFYSR